MAERDINDGVERFKTSIYGEDTICLAELRVLAYRGIPTTSLHNFRPIVWRIFLELLPTDRLEWDQQLQSKRQFYLALKQKYSILHKDNKEMKKKMNEMEEKEREAFKADSILRQEIVKDATRTQGSVGFFALNSPAHHMLVNILFIFAKLNPEIGYVQGMNEVLAPLLYVFGLDMSPDWRDNAEPDAYHCFTSIMQHLKIVYATNIGANESIGIYTQINRLTNLLRRHDPDLAYHCEKLELNADLFSFRWYTALLSREFQIDVTVRIWDTLFADPRRFSFLHYICCSMVISQRERLLEGDFASGIKLLQSFPSSNVEELIEKAHFLRSLDRKEDQTRNAEQMRKQREIIEMEAINKQGKMDYQVHVATEKPQLVKGITAITSWFFPNKTIQNSHRMSSTS